MAIKLIVTFTSQKKKTKKKNLLILFQNCQASILQASRKTQPILFQIY